MPANDTHWIEPHAPSSLRESGGSRIDGRVAARRGLALVAVFWVTIAGLLSARVALFDEISAARALQAASNAFQKLAALVL